MAKWYVGEVKEVHSSDGPVDPGWGVVPPVDPGFGGGRPPHISTGPVLPPLPGVWPPLTPDHPAHPLPPESGWQPGTIWPGSHPIDPGWGAGHPLPPHVGGGPVYPGHPSGQPLPPPGGSTLPEGPPPPNTKPEKFVVLCWISGGIGWNYVVVDTSLVAGMPLPGGPPPTAGNLPGQTPTPKS